MVTGKMKQTITLKIFVLISIFILISINLSVIAIQNNINLSESNENKYDLLIISPKKFSKHLCLLVIHKNRMGVKTKLVNVEEVYCKMFSQGRDDAERVKYYIKDAIENWGIKYVLLVGGRKNQLKSETWWIPVRYSYLDRNYSTLEEKQFLTDLYFADIYDREGNFSSWDNNKNKIFSEWEKNKSAVDIPDLYPDVFVGRLPCRNFLEVRIMVKKIIFYERGKCPDSWFRNMVVVAGDTYPNKTPYYDGEVYTQMGLDMMPGFNPIKLWTSDGSLNSSDDVVKAINEGCGFIWFSGHGGPESWATHPPNDRETWIKGLRLQDMLYLFNGRKLPVCISGSGCFNNMFNVSLMNSPWVYGYTIPRCWGWGLVGKIYGGSIATIAATAFSYESPDIDTGDGGCKLLDMQFFSEYGLNGTDILGETWGNAITSFLNSYPIDWNDNSSTGHALIAKNVQQWLLIGDPSLKIGGYEKKL